MNKLKPTTPTLTYNEAGNGGLWIDCGTYNLSTIIHLETEESESEVEYTKRASKPCIRIL